MKNVRLLAQSRRGFATVPIMTAACCVSVIALGFWTVEHRQKQALEQDRAQTVLALDQAKARIQELTDRINTIEQQRSAQPAPLDATMAVHTERVAPAPRRVVAIKRKPAAVVTRPDPRLDRMQGQLAETEKQLAATRDELARNKEELDGRISSTRDDLNGSIARTHDEVVTLQRRGERNVYEFKLTKSKELHHVGPLSVSLRSTSTKHKTYDLEMVVDDNSLNKKHVNLYEPVWITLSDRPQPVQLVVNHIGKDEIEGYISEPKYKTSELTAKSEQSPNAPQQQLATRAQ